MPPVTALYAYLALLGLTAVALPAFASPDALHISYVHSPMRYAWDLLHQYLRQLLHQSVL